MWIYKTDKLRDSSCYGFNFLFNEGKFFIMDNHLASAWCWIQKVDPKIKHGLFHIDRHYDLVDNLSKETILLNKELLTSEFLNYLHASIMGAEYNHYRLVRFDNYIDIYRKLYPRTLKEYYFATHDEDNYLKSIKSNKPKIWEIHNNLSYWINRSEIGKWIINIDLDYFFQDNDSTQIQFLTDEYVISICKEIEKSMSKIEVVTIALSPQFCGGWSNAFRLLKIFTDNLSINFNQDLWLNQITKCCILEGNTNSNPFI